MRDEVNKRYGGLAMLTVVVHILKFKIRKPKGVIDLCLSYKGMSRAIYL